MSPMPVVQLGKRIKGVKIVTGFSGKAPVEQGRETDPAVGSQATVEMAASQQGAGGREHLYPKAHAALQEAAAKLNQVREDIVAGHHEAIARLSVEIARKIIMRNIDEGNYRIESIIKETLKNAPKSSDIVIRLNPQDLTDLQELQKAGQAAFSGLKLEADPEIGRAECVVESSKGVIKVLIDEYLEQIGKALAETG